MLRRDPWPVILQIIPELYIGGAERTTVEIAEAVARAGGRALVLSKGGHLEQDLAQAGGELIRFPAGTKNPGLIIANAIRIAQIVKQRHVTLLHARSRAPGWSALLAARRTHLPFVTTYHGVYGQKGRLKSFYNSIMARGDAVIANSQYTAGIIRGRHKAAEDRLHIIPRGADLEVFNPASLCFGRVAAIRDLWGVKNERVILLPGRLTPWKGQRLLIEAVARLVQNGQAPAIKVILAGSDQGRSAYSEGLRAMIADLGLTGIVHLAGHCKDMPAAFAAAYITVVPSLQDEAFGRVSVEAQAMQCPVIVSDIGALPETLGVKPDADLIDLPKLGGSGLHLEIEPFSPENRVNPRFHEGVLFGNGSKSEGQHWDGVKEQARIRQVEAGWIFPPGDALQLAQALAAALDAPPAVRTAMGQAGREHVTAFYSKAAMQVKTLQVYDRLLGTALARAFNAIPML